MENFKSHGNTVIEFDTGISLIIGENGAGKSSVLEAVSFALFKSHSGRNMDILVKNDAKGMMVELDFVSNGREYRVKRVRGKSGSEPRLSLKQDDRVIPIATKDRQVTEEVQNILEMDSDLFLNAVYVKQGEISDLIEKSPAEKKKMIGKLLGIENLETAWKNMQPLVSSYEMKKAEIKGTLEVSESLKEKCRVNNKKLQETETLIQKLEFQIKDESDKLTEISQSLIDMELNKNKFDSLNSVVQHSTDILNRVNTEKDSLEVEISSIQDKENDIKSIEPDLKKIEPLNLLHKYLNKEKLLIADEERTNQSIERIVTAQEAMEENKEFYDEFLKLQDEINALQGDRKHFDGSLALFNQITHEKEKITKKIVKNKEKIIETLESYNSILETESKTVEEFEIEFNEIKPQIEQEKDELNIVIEKLNTRIASLEIQNQSLEKPIKELKKVKDQCPICQSPIDEDKRSELINGYLSDINDNKANIQSFKDKLQNILNEKTSIDTKLKHIKGINSQLLKEKLNALEEADTNLKELDDKLKNLNNEVLRLQTIDRDLNLKKEFLKTLEDPYQKYLKAKGSLESMGDHEEYLSSLEDVQRNLSSINTEIRRIQEETGVLLEDLDQEIGHLEKVKIDYHRMLGEVSKKPEIMKKLGEKLGEIDEINDFVSRKKEEIDQLCYDSAIHQKMKNKEYDLNSNITSLKTQKSELVGKRAELSRNMEDLKSEMRLFQKNKKQFDNISDFIKLLKFIRDIFGKDGIQRELRNRSKPLIEERTREFFERFNFDYSDIRIDEDYDLTVYGPGGESSLDMISGGEKIAVALALRLGITQALSGGNLELIMLDEPTIHLDAYRRHELIDLLKRMSIIPQMIIVTHDYDLEEAADNVLRIKKEEGNSFLVES
jgi:exonuclease SbcC